jgi:hypothetical protein
MIADRVRANPSLRRSPDDMASVSSSPTGASALSTVRLAMSTLPVWARRIAIRSAV